MAKTALIIGVSGQTGSLLSRHLLNLGYDVIGGSRDTASTDWWRLEKLGIKDDITLATISPSDLDNVLNALNRFAPDEIYFLGGQSSVALSFTQPVEAFESIAGATLNFLEAIRLSESQAKFFNAASTDCFGNQPGLILDEKSPMKPVSPYGVAKTASYLSTVNYREAFGLLASNGILTNTESTLRGGGFVTQKVISTLRLKKKDPSITLRLGQTAIRRDWLWAVDAVEAIHLIASHPTPGDFIVASGQTHSLHDFVAQACIQLNLDPADAYEIDASLFRPHEIASIELDPSRIRAERGWSAKTSFPELVEKLITEQEAASPSHPAVG